jgi:ribonuclease HI
VTAPREPEVITVRLTISEAEVVINGLRGWVHRQVHEDPRTAAQTPVEDEDPWPEDMAAVADRIELAWREATG